MAIQRGFKVGRVGLGILTDCCITIMAGLAVINDAGMIVSRPDETTGCVTYATILIGWNMSAWFVYGETSTMT